MSPKKKPPTEYLTMVPLKVNAAEGYTLVACKCLERAVMDARMLERPTALLHNSLDDCYPWAWMLYGSKEYHWDRLPKPEPEIDPSNPFSEREPVWTIGLHRQSGNEKDWVTFGALLGKGKVDELRFFNRSSGKQDAMDEHYRRCERLWGIKDFNPEAESHLQEDLFT